MEHAEAAAAATLASVPGYIWDGERLPVPIDEIAEDWFGLQVREVADLSAAPGCPPLSEGQILSGLLLAAPGEIWVNESEAREWPGRRRFTIAHELGHWRMHRTSQQSLFCRKASVEENPGHGDVEASQKPAAARPPLPPTEEEANVFAACLLMPAELIEHHYRKGGEFDRLCELFGSSRAAMGRRLHQVI